MERVVARRRTMLLLNVADDLCGFCVYLHAAQQTHYE